MKDLIMFLVGLVILFLLAFSISLYDHMIRMKYIKKRTIEDYGKEIDLDDVIIKMDSVSSYFRNKKVKSSIDDITWNDLSMDDIFKKINNTQSSAGAEVLYDMLRNPIYENEKLNKRDKLIEYFRNNEKERREIQYILGKLGKSNDLYTTNCLFNKLDLSKSKLLQYRLLSLLPILSLMLVLLNGYFFILVVISLAYNVYLSQNNKKYKYNTDGFTYIVSIVNAANRIKNLDIEEINENLDNIDNDLQIVRHIRRKNVSSNSNDLTADINIFSEYIRILFLRDLITYEKVKNTVIKRSDNFKSIYDFVGSIDAIIGVSSFRESLKCYSKPSLSNSNSKNENKLEFIDIYHPLIKNPVKNSGEFSHGILVTGSNASGKSTFIKTIAINAILSQTIYTACAKNYSSSFFDIYTSMALKDDIFSNESYYIVEIKSLKRIIDRANRDIPCLCFVDEILRGTNTIERIASSCEVLSYLGRSNCICFAATHDIELTHLLDEIFENYHFEETITNKDIAFDYKLHKGRTQTRNAIKLLGFMGYDEDIVTSADNRAKKFLETGKW